MIVVFAYICQSAIENNKKALFKGETDLKLGVC